MKSPGPWIRVIKFEADVAWFVWTSKEPDRPLDEWRVYDRVIGFARRQGKKPWDYAIIDCPMCRKKNYPLGIAGYSCPWCQFDPRPVIKAKLKL